MICFVSFAKSGFATLQDLNSLSIEHESKNFLMFLFLFRILQHIENEYEALKEDYKTLVGEIFSVCWTGSHVVNLFHLMKLLILGRDMSFTKCNKGI